MVELGERGNMRERRQVMKEDQGFIEGIYFSIVHSFCVTAGENLVGDERLVMRNWSQLRHVNKL